MRVRRDLNLFAAVILLLSPALNGGPPLAQPAAAAWATTVRAPAVPPDPPEVYPSAGHAAETKPPPEYPADAGQVPYNPLDQGLAGEIEPNNTSATATLISGSSAVIRGYIFPNNDVDYFAFSANAGDRVYAATMTAASPASANSILDVIGADGTTVLESDDNDGSIEGTSSSIAGTVIPASGTYYLRVRQFSSAQIRPYHLYLRVQSGSPDVEAEPNDSLATANPLPASGWVSGVISATSDSDYFSLILNAGDTIYAGLDLDPTRDNTQWNGQLGLALFGGSILMVNDEDAGSPANPLSEATFMTVKQAGTYYVRVNVPAGATATGDYHLSVSVLPATAATANCTTYSSSDVPRAIGPAAGLITSTLTIPGSPRIADLNATITLTHSLLADLNVSLVSPAGNENALFTEIGDAGGPTMMNMGLDDEAAMPPLYSVVEGMNYQLEYAYRLAWFDGEDAGGTWTLNLRDDTAGDAGELQGWSLTVCEPPPPAVCPLNTSPVTVYSSDFETDGGGFTHAGTQDEWERGLPSFAPLTSCHSGVNCWKTDLDNTYNANSNQDLLSPAIDLAGYVGPVQVTWAQKYQMESATYDRAFVDVQQVGGTNATRLWQWLDGTMSTSVGALEIQESAGWGTFTRDISSYAGSSIELRFHLDSDISINYAGYAIDDVMVTACLPDAGADLSISKSADPDPVLVGQPLTYTLLIDNGGPQLAAAPTVTDDLPGGVVVSSVTPSSGTCASGERPDDGGQVVCDLSDMATGSTVTVTVVVTPTVAIACGTTITNSAAVSSVTLDPNTDNNDATIATQVECPQYCMTTPSGDVPLAIPDVSTITSTLAVSLSTPLSLLEVVGINISHTYPGDLDVYLVSPANVAVELFSNVCGTTDWTAAGTGFNLADSGGALIGTTCPPGPATYRPENPLAVLNSSSPAGVWRLRVSDVDRGDTGTLNGWGLFMCGYSGCYDVNHDTTVDVSDIVSVAMHWLETPASPAWDAQADLNGDGIVDIIDIMLLSRRFGDSGVVCM